MMNLEKPEQTDDPLTEHGAGTRESKELRNGRTLT